MEPFTLPWCRAGLLVSCFSPQAGQVVVSLELFCFSFESQNFVVVPVADLHLVEWLRSFAWSSNTQLRAESFEMRLQHRADGQNLASEPQEEYSWLPGGSVRQFTRASDGLGPKQNMCRSVWLDRLYLLHHRRRSGAPNFIGSESVVWLLGL